MRKLRLNVNAVLVGDRYRDTLGDLTELAASMAKEGQQRPIAVLDSHELFCGERRLEAARMLGWTTIDAVRVTSLAQAVEVLDADRRHAMVARGTLAMNVVERVAMVEPLYSLREREAGVPLQPSKAGGGTGISTAIEALIVPAIALPARRYREIRFAYLITKGRRFRRNPKPVTDQERKLAAEALRRMKDGDGASTATFKMLRAQLGYRPRAHHPSEPVDPNRTTFERKSVRPRKPLLPQVEATISELARLVGRLRRHTDDDRWPDSLPRLAASARYSLHEAAEWLAKLTETIPSPDQENPK